MDESQFHDFLAGAPLDPTTLESLRRALPKGQLTPTRLTAMLKDGTLPLDPTSLIERHFDISVSIAGWGERELALALPKGAISLDAAQRYLDGDLVAAWETDKKLILELGVEDELLAARDPREWLPSLLPLRAKLLAGDPRPLYLGWLVDVAKGELAADEREPPVPAGLAALDSPLAAMCEFLSIPAGLVAAAASASPPLEADRDAAARKRWLAQLSAADKEAWLARVMADGPLEPIRQELRAACASSVGTPSWPMAKTRRTAGELRRLAIGAVAEAPSLRVAAPPPRVATMTPPPRVLAPIVAPATPSHAPAPPVVPIAPAPAVVDPWESIDAALASRRPEAYERAARLLKDVQQRYAASKQPADYPDRLRALLKTHGRKTRWVEALDEAGVQR